MPAIPALARVEAHLTDEELMALAAFVDDACAGFDALHTISEVVEVEDRLAAGGGNGKAAFQSLRKALHATRDAASRALTERAA